MAYIRLCFFLCFSATCFLASSSLSSELLLLLEDEDEDEDEDEELI